jgi:hypothetical protein
VPDELADDQTFGFMASTVSSESRRRWRRIAERLRQVKAAGDKVLWVGGPAIVHTGAPPRWSRWCGPGSWTLFAGNALATHDIEAAVRHVARRRPQPGAGVPHGHEHHIRAINRIRAAGSIGAAVEQGADRRRHARDG